GRSLQGKLNTRVAYEQQLEQKMELITDAQKAQLAQAAEMAEKRAESNRAREKEAGYKWLSFNDQDVKALEGAIKDIKKEIERAGKVKVEPLAEKAEEIYLAETLLMEGKLLEAESRMREAVGGSATSKKMESSKVSQIQRFVTALNVAKEEKRKAAELAAIKAAPKETAVEEVEEAPTGGPSAEELLAMVSEPTTTKKESDSAKPKSDPKSSSGSSSEERTPPPLPAASSGGGGFNPMALMPVILGVLLVATGVIWFVDKKKKAAAGEEE
ncbi:MAG: hypothetical protein AAF191_13580, partial [Verrucomicrobiota bacterium]